MDIIICDLSQGALKLIYEMQVKQSESINIIILFWKVNVFDSLWGIMCVQCMVIIDLF